ncbi:hypothetical protein BZZ01_04940 [Nostocales cyanobacterium HT-58-2]|nr:hypothetical protein BZZ01_04940 [Nostocales cyanobacterium HT-58-2]
MLSRTSFRLEKPILYNNVNAQSLYGALIDPANIAKVGGFRRIPAGSFLAAKNRLLPRARIISPYTSGSATVIVSNPYPFKVGDVLKVIGTPTSTPIQESQAVNNATAADFGTVTAIDTANNKQVTTVTPAAVAVGNVFSLTIEGATISYTATTTTAADVAKGLKNNFDAAKSPTGALFDLRAEVNGDSLVFTHEYLGEIAEIVGNVVQGAAATTGTLAVTVTQSVGALTITPASGNTNQVIGNKIGTITDLVLGVITHDHLLTDDDGIDTPRALAAYDSAMVNTKALPYLDGHIVNALPRLAFTPRYGV